ncbi:MAG TPA: hypothetical protein VEU06_11200 [Micropepsaceae bacterium]|nr:hypothetical protein [Micropepsaceae bacterium]
MTRVWAYALIVLAIPSCAGAASAPPSAPANPTCIDAKNSPDYTPGVDARGKAVAPADLPTQGNVEVSTHVFAEVRTNNRQVPRVGVEVNLDALRQLPPCPPAPKKPIVHEH